MFQSEDIAFYRYVYESFCRCSNDMLLLYASV